MTMKFHPNIRNLMIGQGLLAGFANPCAISIYSGVQPTAASITETWPSYSSGNSNFLLHYIGASWSQPSSGILLQLGIPPATTAFRGGVATWAVLWSTNVSTANVALGTLPTTSFIVVPCSISTGNGVIRFTNPNIVNGASTVILDGSIGGSSF